MKSILEHTNGIKDVLLLICFYLELLFVLVINSYCLPFRLVRSKRLLDQSCQMLLQDCSSDMLVIGRQDFFSFSFLKKLLPYFPTWWCLQPHAFMCACSSVYLLYLIHMRNLLRFGLLIDYHMLWYAFTCYFVCLLYNIFILSILWLMHVRDKVVDFHWNTSDPWTIVSVSDDCGSTGGGGTLQVMDFFSSRISTVNQRHVLHICSFCPSF